MPPHAPPDVHVEAISRFDNWDARECAVANADEWRSRVNDFISSHDGCAPIPKHIHQIWIGTREPPCVWLDSWRIDFMASHGGTDWNYTLWDNKAVATMRTEEELINADIYERERMWQCKADLLRLELLYRYGGVYIDADLISLGKPLDGCLEMARATGFGISYEADTKDKPYSVLGNSIIFASKGHPLLALLIHYIRAIYDHKRPHFGVEWTTGPLAYHKCLIHSNMPVTMIPRQYFYPTFHFIPNPDAINPDAFPESIGFQFGYTCSNLGEWVKHNNRCRRALDCPHHKARKDYPLGAITPFPDDEHCVEDGEIPKIIHQFSFTSQPPSRWIDTWAKNFCSDNADWTHRVWTFEDLRREGSFFCSHLYPESKRHMDDQTLRLLALEILYKHGGYYIPITSLYAKGDRNVAGDGAFPPVTKKGMSAAAGGIVGSVKNGLACVKLIKSFYSLGKMPKLAAASTRCTDVDVMGVSDATAMYLAYPSGSRFLGAGRVLFSTAGKYGIIALPTAVVYAYDAQVPVYPCVKGDIMQTLKTERNADSAVVFTDAAVARLPRVIDAIAGVIYRAQQMDADWDYATLSLEWSAGFDDETVDRVQAPMLPEHVHCFGVVVNTGRSERLEGSNVIQAVLSRHARDKVYAGTVRFAHDETLSAVYSAMPVVADVMWRIAGHSIPSWHSDEREVHGRLLKGLRGGQLAYELNVDEERRVFYRAFNDDGGMNCEARISQGAGGRHVVEHARVFFDHAIVYEGSQVCL